MKNTHKKKIFYFFVILMVTAYFFADQEVLAADGSGNWRPTYDLVMRGLNFAILAFLIVKFARTPFAKFLNGQKEKVKRQIRQVEENKAAATQKIQETIKSVDKSDGALGKLKQRIVAQGKRKKDQIITEARLESRLILEEAKRRVDNRIRQAKNNLRTELVDTAINSAIEKLPHEITAEDDQKLIQTYLSSISSK